MKGLKDKKVWVSFLLIFAIIVLGTGGILLARHQKLAAEPSEAPSPTVAQEPITNGEESSGEEETAVPPQTNTPSREENADGTDGERNTQAPQQAPSSSGAETLPSQEPPVPAMPDSGGQEPAAETETPRNVSQVTLSIQVPDENRYILSPVKVDLEEEDTVLTVLLRATRERKIQMEYSGGKKNAYVEGIDNLYEFSKGAGSGWMYTVNGAFAGKSCGGVTVKENDIICWIYTLDLGKDIQGKV